MVSRRDVQGAGHLDNSAQHQPNHTSVKGPRQVCVHSACVCPCRCARVPVQSGPGHYHTIARVGFKKLFMGNPSTVVGDNGQNNWGS